MKRLFLLILPLLAITFNSCSKDDGGDDLVDNKFTISGKTYEVTKAYYDYYSHEEISDNMLLAISLETKEGVYIDIDDIFVPNSNTKLVAGTYTHNKSKADFTFWHGEIYDDSIDYEEIVKGGTVKVAIADNTYTITINCTLESGGTIKGTYKGTLPARN